MTSSSHNKEYRINVGETLLWLLAAGCSFFIGSYAAARYGDSNPWLISSGRHSMFVHNASPEERLFLSAAGFLAAAVSLLGFVGSITERVYVAEDGIVILGLLHPETRVGWEEIRALTSRRGRHGRVWCILTTQDRSIRINPALARLDDLLNAIRARAPHLREDATGF